MPLTPSTHPTPRSSPAAPRTDIREHTSPQDTKQATRSLPAMEQRHVRTSPGRRLCTTTGTPTRSIRARHHKQRCRVRLLLCVAQGLPQKSHLEQPRPPHSRGGRRDHSSVSDGFVDFREKRGGCPSGRGGVGVRTQDLSFCHCQVSALPVVQRRDVAHRG